MPNMRIFGSTEATLESHEIVQFIQQGWPGSCVMVEDDANAGWLSVHVEHPQLPEPIGLDRFCRVYDDITGELMSWAAWLETREGTPQSKDMMARTIAVQQVVLIKCPEGAEEKRICRELSRVLADVADGFFQVDDEGFYDASGVLVIQE